MDQEGIKIIEEQEAPSMEGIQVQEDGNISIHMKENEPESPIKVVEEDQRNDEGRERKRNRRPLNARPNHVQISALKNMINEREAENQRLISELQQKEYALQQAQMIAAHKEQVAVINNEYALKLRQKQAEDDFNAAIEAMDSKKAAEASQLMANTAVELKELERLKQQAPDIYAVQQHYQDQHYFEPPYNNPPPPQEPFIEDLPEDPEVIEEIDNAVNDFLAENPQFDYRKKDYDPSMYRKFMSEGKRLASAYLEQGDHDYVNSKEFLEEVSREVQSRSASRNIQPTSRRSGPMVAPVNRGSGSYNGGNRDFVFTRTEFEPFSKLPELMKEKDPQKLAAQYMKIKQDLTNKGLLGRGLSPRNRMHVSTSI